LVLRLANCVRVDNCRDDGEDDDDDEGQWNRSIRIAAVGAEGTQDSGAFDSSWAKIFNDWHDCLSYLMTFSSAANRPR